MANYYKTSDPWEAIALAAAQNEGYTYNDGVTVRRVAVQEYSGTYYVIRLDDIDNLGAPFVDYDTMALDFPPVEI